MGVEAGWNLEAPPGFRGLDPNRPVTVLQRHLPHWRQSGATYFVTFRLADSLPQSKLDELAALRKEWDRRHPPPVASDALEALWRETFRRVDGWLDQGFGSCRLKDQQAGELVAGALHHFDEKRYELDCYVVMPNHVHLIVRPYDEDVEALSRITHSWKRFTARKINKRDDLEGPFWQDESYDRIIRDEEHLWRIIQYMGRNPPKASLGKQGCQLWIRPEWRQLGWEFSHEVGELRSPF